MDKRDSSKKLLEKKNLNMELRHKEFIPEEIHKGSFINDVTLWRDGYYIV